MEYAGFTLTNMSECILTGYTKAINRSDDLTVIVGGVPRYFPGLDVPSDTDTMAELLDLQLPVGWQELVPGMDDIQFVQKKWHQI